MDRNFPGAHKKVLAYEGNYSNHPRDPGGVTLQGVTQRTYDAYRDRKNLPRRKLTAAMRDDKGWIRERDEIYRSGYWIPPGCALLNDGVDAAIYDYSVNSGPGRPIRVLRKLVGMPPGKAIDAATITAANKRNPEELVKAICAERLAFLMSLPTWSTFGGGWSSRVRSVMTYAGALARGAQAPVIVDDSPSIGRGEVPENKKAKKAIVVGSATGGGTAAGGFSDWISAHPIPSILIAAAVIGAIVFAIHRISARRDRLQLEPMPGFEALPESPAPAPAPQEA